ncbi:tigger transposable element-derived protein 1-like [Portunus trituberculatus]|uniref:tigger transposable element-derived protein 1-like n=1 Tax=Portunus trituberculatus TaxID=210409 RepID=UPI001E1CEA96|nr:tigger transposable element-derived protein 1-like [Portunus trituberculatus]
MTNEYLLTHSPANTSLPVPRAHVLPQLKTTTRDVSTSAEDFPVRRGLITTFKHYYTCCTLRATNVALAVCGVSVKGFWWEFNVRAAIEDITAAWDEVQNNTMNAEDLHQEIVELANSARLSAEGEDAINVDNIAELVQSHTDDLSTEDLVEQQQKLAAREEVEEESPVPKVMTLADLMALVQSGLNFIDVVLTRDGNTDRSFQVRTAVQALLRPYEECLRQKRARGKQTNITKFFTSSVATSLPPPSPSPEMAAKHVRSVSSSLTLPPSFSSSKEDEM